MHIVTQIRIKKYLMNGPTLLWYERPLSIRQPFRENIGMHGPIISWWKIQEVNGVIAPQRKNDKSDYSFPRPTITLSKKLFCRPPLPIPPQKIEIMDNYFAPLHSTSVNKRQNINFLSPTPLTKISEFTPPLP